MDGQRKSPGRVAARAEAIGLSTETKYTPALQRAEAADFEVIGETAPYLPPGKYQAQFIGWWTGVMFGKRPKLALKFRIVDVGEYFGKVVIRWYNARRLIGSRGDSGRFQVGRHSDFLADFARLAGLPTRADRAPMSRLKKVVLLVEVVTVTQRRNQEEISTALRYSVVRKLLAVVAGSIQETDLL